MTMIERSGRDGGGFSPDRPSRPGRGEDGFTLVEMLVVLAIIGLIATLATPRVLRYLGSAKVSTTVTQIRNLEGALELYYLDNGAYPETSEGLSALVKAPDKPSNWNGPYLKGSEVIKDAWGHEFRYELKDNGSTVSILSLGADGKEGGTDTNADISN
ncbi:general secretion pathway protein G [Hoeflea marina]|uniref:Type II secretion system core protein G n=1 Tax=Hoeflea marina TaxID=274592 RepID=A0A317PRL2_9HYPH|nr:type II secretion system major pseudopilin GspG [Hoeflea marina]PWW01524.1 general secretion pathway protein G [Hoeflea marina]